MVARIHMRHGNIGNVNERIIRQIGIIFTYNVCLVTVLPIMRIKAAHGNQGSHSLHPGGAYALNNA